MNDKESEYPPITRKRTKVVKNKRRVYSSTRERDDARNLRRNLRRKEDKDYRAKLLKQARDNRRNKLGISGCSHVVITSSDEIKKAGSIKTITHGINKEQTHITYDIDQLCKVLGGNEKQSVYRWFREKLIPPMLNKVKGGIVNERGTYKYIKVYTYDEVKHICRILSMHNRNRSCNFGKEHETVINFIANAIEKERKNYES